jgi:hypothetical protein
MITLHSRYRLWWIRTLRAVKISDSMIIMQSDVQKILHIFFCKIPQFFLRNWPTYILADHKEDFKGILISYFSNYDCYITALRYAIWSLCSLFVSYTATANASRLMKPLCSLWALSLASCRKISSYTLSFQFCFMLSLRNMQHKAMFIVGSETS